MPGVMQNRRSDKAQLFDKARSLLNLPEGHTCHVLDFGCGKGELLGRLSETMHDGSRLVGVDAMERAIVQARDDFPTVEFICDKFVDRLCFNDSSFDAVVTIDAIECVPDKAALLKEIHRILKPRGKIVAMHWDWDTQTYNIQSKELARRAVQAFSDWKQPWMEDADGQMGRKLWGLFEGSNLFRGRSDTYCLVETEYCPGKYGFDRARDLSGLVERGGFDSVDYESFCKELSDSSAKGQYHYTVTSFIYCGTRA